MNPVPIQYAGLELINENQRKILDKLSMEYYDRIKRYVKNLTSIKIHLKEYEKEGKKHKFSIHMRVYSPTKNVFVSTKASDWDFARCLHKAFNDLINNIKKKLRADTSTRKAYY